MKAKPYRAPRPRIVRPEGRYEVEVYDTPKGLYVQRRYASHGCLVSWQVMTAALRRRDKRNASKPRRIQKGGVL